jgi:hypothetical protein
MLNKRDGNVFIIILKTTIYCTMRDQMNFRPRVPWTVIRHVEQMTFQNTPDLEFIRSHDTVHTFEYAVINQELLTY